MRDEPLLKTVFLETNKGRLSERGCEAYPGALSLLPLDWEFFSIGAESIFSE